MSDPVVAARERVSTSDDLGLWNGFFNWRSVRLVFQEDD
jgi:hypothetical protein